MMLAPRIAARERGRRQAITRHRHELVALQPQQARGVTGDQSPHGVEQTRVPIAGADRRRQILSDVEEHLQRRTKSLLFRQHGVKSSTPVGRLNHNTRR
jgi:hypothetical protein